MGNAVLIKAIIVLLIAGSGFIRWLFVKLQEQAAKKRVQDELERRKAEAFRTGRDLDDSVTVNPGAQKARAEAEAAARRQAQIDEFRRRQQERARQRAEAQRGNATFSSPQPGPIPQRTAPAPPAPVSRPAAAVVAARPAASKPALRKPLFASAAEPETPARAAPGAMPQPVQAAARATLGRPQSAEQWRRAIIMNTLLSPPPGLGAGEDPWSPVA